MKAFEKRVLAALGAQAGAFAVVGLLGGLARVGTVPAPAPTPTVTITTTLTPQPVISTSTVYVPVSPTGHHHKAHVGQSAGQTAAAQPTPGVTPDQIPGVTANPGEQH
jgi:hypothetical protein